MELKTFTIDSCYGKENEELRELTNKYELKIIELCNSFITECDSNSIESCSSNGWFVDTIIYALANCRMKLFYNKLKNGEIKEIGKDNG